MRKPTARMRLHPMSYFPRGRSQRAACQCHNVWISWQSGKVVRSAARDRRWTFRVNQPRSSAAGSRNGLPRSKRTAERGDTVLFVAGTEGRAERTAEPRPSTGRTPRHPHRFRDPRVLNVAVHIAVGQLSKASVCLAPGCRLLPSRTCSRKSARRSSARETGTVPSPRRSSRTCAILKVEDLVVHVDYGIGRFVGLRQIGVGDSMQEFMELRYFGRQAVRSRRAARPRPEVQRTRRSPRSTSSVALPGNAPKRASRRPCATWPRSCSSFTRRARRLCRANQLTIALAARVR